MYHNKRSSNSSKAMQRYHATMETELIERTQLEANLVQTIERQMMTFNEGAPLEHEKASDEDAITNDAQDGLHAALDANFVNLLSRSPRDKALRQVALRKLRDLPGGPGSRYGLEDHGEIFLVYQPKCRLVPKQSRLSPRSS